MWPYISVKHRNTTLPTHFQFPIVMNENRYFCSCSLIPDAYRNDYDDSGNELSLNLGWDDDA